jgi:hypothetical protein
MDSLSALTDAELLHSTRLHLQRAHALDAELLLLLGEVDARRLYAQRAFSSMFAFCTGELGFSEDVACNRIAVARLARRLPRVLDFVRAGRVHLSGLRLLDAHLTEENLEEVLAAASGKSKRDVEELVARLSPRPPVPPSIRKLPQARLAVFESPPSLPLPVTEAPRVEAPPVSAPLPPLPRKPAVEPLSAEAYRVEFTADRSLKNKLEQAEELMRHRVGKGNLVAVIERALDLLIAEVTKERFGVGRKPRSTAAEGEGREVVSRHIPDAIKREVYVRDGGQCTFVAEDGRRCEERGGLEFEHPAGFARTGRHAVAELKLFCRSHNQHSADQLYGRDFMQDRRRRIRPGTGEDSQSSLL